MEQSALLSTRKAKCSPNEENLQRVAENSSGLQPGWTNQNSLLALMHDAWANISAGQKTAGSVYQPRISSQTELQIYVEGSPPPPMHFMLRKKEKTVREQCSLTGRLFLPLSRLLGGSVRRRREVPTRVAEAAGVKTSIKQSTFCLDGREFPPCTFVAAALNTAGEMCGRESTLTVHREGARGGGVVQGRTLAPCWLLGFWLISSDEAQLHDSRGLINSLRFTSVWVFYSPSSCASSVWDAHREWCMGARVHHSLTLWPLIGFISVYVSKFFVTGVNIHQVGANGRISSWKEALRKRQNISQQEKAQASSLLPAGLQAWEGLEKHAHSTQITMWRDQDTHAHAQKSNGVLFSKRPIGLACLLRWGEMQKREAESERPGQRSSLSLCPLPVSELSLGDEYLYCRGPVLLTVDLLCSTVAEELTCWRCVG